MAIFTFRGLIAPTLTPFNADLTLNLDLIQSYVEYLAKRKIKGILVNGTSGEGTNMTVAERKLLTEAWVKAASKHKIHVMVQVGGVPFPDVVELVKHAVLVKVDSLLTLPELYNKPKSIEELVDYLEAISKHAPKTPLLYYNIPVLTNVEFNMPTFITEAKKRVPTFSGIKYTSDRMVEGCDCLLAGNKDHAVFLGADQIFVGAVAMGYDSAIATALNMFEHLPNIQLAANNGDYHKARKIQEELNEILQEVTEGVGWVPLCKALMSLLTPIDVGPPRFPHKPVTKEHLERMKAKLIQKNLI